VKIGVAGVPGIWRTSVSSTRVLGVAMYFGSTVGSAPNVAVRSVSTMRLFVAS
jgi:hypothetical protein